MRLSPGPPIVPAAISAKPRNSQRWPAAGEACEIVGALVHRLQERRLGVDKAAVDEHAGDLGDDALGRHHMLQHRLDPDAVEARVGEGQAVAVGDDLDVGRGVDVGANEANVTCAA